MRAFCKPCWKIRRNNRPLRQQGPVTDENRPAEYPLPVGFLVLFRCHSGEREGEGEAPCSGVEKCGGNAFRRPNPAALLGCFRRIGHYFLVFFREKKEIPGFLWQCWPQFGILRLYGVEPAAWLRPKTRAAARRGHASAGGVPRRRTTCTNPPTRPSRTGAPCGRP